MEIEWLILADFAQAIENKLYLMGGGWDRLTVNSGFPVRKPLGIAASVIVPWNETNQDGNFDIEVITEDGASLMKMEGTFRVGRPPTHPPGQDQRFQIAVTGELTIKEPGTYVLVARLEGREGARTHFNVVPGPQLKQQPRAG